MARILCKKCEKPVKACICSFITAIDNNITVVILQHPNEVNQMKATVPLIAHSLNNCQVIIGDNFSENEQVNQLIKDYQQRCVLLYPQDDAQSVCDYAKQYYATSSVENSCENDDKRTDIKANELCLIVLDGTWKKTYRMYMESSNLHSLTKLSLPENITGQYHIRKTKKANALSTLEACYYCLRVLESEPDKYLPLIDNFTRFNQFQLSFRPPEHVCT